jgi:DNA polymerase-3 subunit beta
MEVVIDKVDLQNILKKVISATEKKSVLPALANFLIEAKEDKLIVQGTDLEVHVLASVFADIKEEGVVSVNAKKLTDISRLLPQNEVLLKLEDNKLKIQSGKTKYNLPVFSVEEFPQMYPFPQDSSFTISGEELLNGINKTIYAAAKDETRFALQGVLFRTRNEGIDAVATDGHRLALYQMEKSGNGEMNEILPQKALNELKKLITGLEDIEVASTEQYAFFKTADWILMTRLIEGEFPDYTQFIPQEFVIEITVDKKDFIESVKRVSAIFEGEPKPIKLTLKENKIELKSFSQELGEAVDELDIEYSGDEFSIGFNAKYILDAVNVIDGDKVQIKFTGPESQTLILPEDNTKYQAIVMPMEIDF